MVHLRSTWYQVGDWGRKMYFRMASSLTYMCGFIELLGFFLLALGLSFLRLLHVAEHLMG